MPTRSLVNTLGTNERVLAGNPQMTYMKEVYKRTTRCSNQVIMMQFPKTVTYGSEMTMDLYQEGDLIDNVWVRLVFPSSLTSTVCDSFGTYVFNWVQLEYENQIIERLHGEYIEMFNDITVNQGRQGALTQFVGKNTTTPLTTYTIKLPFSAFRLSFPVCALKQNPRIRFNIRNFSECGTGVTTNPQFNATLLVDYVFLEEKERNFFINNSLKYLVGQNQLYSTQLTAQQPINTVFTQFRNPCKELFFVLQTPGTSPYAYNSTVLNSLRIVLNDKEYLKAETGFPLFLRVVSGLDQHTRIPDRQFYMYSFSLDPENPRSTGSMNFGLIGRQQFDFTLNTPASPVNLRMYMRAYNVMQIQDGTLAMLFYVPTDITL
jgi:Large eukaryotic DNA virus major capsid protein/Major capsid protein N-terminus